jgi:hypothetical protein
MAVLASFVTASPDGAGPTPVGGPTLDAYLRDRVFADVDFATVDPVAADVAGFSRYLHEYSAGLAVERTAVDALQPTGAAS